MRSIYPSLAALAVLGIIAFPGAGHAKSKKSKTAVKEPQDSIEVVGHIPVPGSPVTRFLTTEHYSSYYLYAEHQSGQGVTLIDVTKADRPNLVADMPTALAGSSDTLSVVAGTAAVVTNSATVSAPAANQTIRIMDFSDPQRSRVTREFTGVTATTRDDRRGLIFVANSEGVWILQQHFAEDPEIAKAYANYVLYGPSMYPPKK